MEESKEKYEAEITKKLDAFKTAKEWSDFISLLSSLDATIRRFSIPDIPRKKLLFKRLNQCLNPVLPAGIHNKALETYALVFERISRENMVRDFDFLTLGLFTFSAHCRILVTNSFLDVMERHIVPLGGDVEDYCTNVLIGLLPPMEFESGEYYSRAHLITAEFKSLVCARTFYASLWSILLNDERLRICIVNFVLSVGREDTMMENTRLLSKALCAGLASESTLVVRGCLDLLIFLFPSRSSVADEEILHELAEGVVKLFVKRDLSLNKRIYSWMELNGAFDEKNVGLLTRTLRRFLDRGTPGDIQFFFRILMTLQDKRRLCETIVESLLFDALMCLERFRAMGAEADYDMFGERMGEKADTEKVARMFLTTDLDGLWKTFYLKLKSSLEKHAKKKMLLDSDSLEEADFGDVSLRDEISSMHTMSLILNEGSAAEQDIAEESSEDGDGDEEHVVLQKLLAKNRSPQRRGARLCIDEGTSLNPSQILGLVQFAVDTYSVTDVEVQHHHLPFLTHLILCNFLLFESKALFPFLEFSLGIMRFREEQTETTASLQKLVNRFYSDENPEILDETSGIVLYSLSERIARLAEYNVALSSPVVLRLIQTHGVDVFPAGFAQSYYRLTLKSSTKLIGEQTEIYRLMDCSGLDPRELFDVLWERFCYMERDLFLESSKRLNEYGEENMYLGLSEDGCEPMHRFFRHAPDEFTDHRFLAELLCGYNAIFGNAFGGLLLRKIAENQIEEICHFLLLKNESVEGPDFLELYYVVNCRLEQNNPVLTTLLCSLTVFDGIFAFLVRKLEESNIQTKDFLFVGSPDSNQVLGVLRCFENLLRHSRRFRVMLRDSAAEMSSSLFSGTRVRPREMLYKALAYLLVNKGDHNDRKICMEAISVLNILVREEVLTNAVLSGPEIPRIIEMAKRNRNDAAIVLGIIPTVRCTGNSVAILDMCSILDYRCFFYYGFLEFVFSLTERLQRKVLVNILTALKNEDFALMIMHEVMESLLTKRGIENELPEFVEKSIGFILEFFESQHVVRGEERLDECRRVNLKIDAMKLNAAKGLSALFFRKLPFKFVEAILNHAPNLAFLQNIDFKEELYISILNSHSNNSAKTFLFLDVFDQVVSVEEQRGIFGKSRNVFEKISAYRVGSDYASLRFSLKVILALNLRKTDEALAQSIVLNAIYFLQRRLDLKARGSEDDYREDIGLLWSLAEFRFTDCMLMAVPGLVTVVFTLVNSQSSDLKKTGIDLLIKLSENGLEVKHWKREFLEIFHTLDFFAYRLYEKSLLMKRLVTEDSLIINDLIARLEGSFFVSQASDANNKTLVLKRISFIIFSAPFNYFAGFSLKLIEKIASLINHPSSKVKRETFFLSKMLLLKIPHDKLINLYPVVFYDVGIVVESVEEDMGLLAEVLRLLDTVFLLNTSQLAEIRLVFLIPARSEDGEQRDIFGSLNATLRERHGVKARSEMPTPIRKIPFLSSREASVEDMVSFTACAPAYYAWLDENCSEIDYEFLFYLVLGELREM